MEVHPIRHAIFETRVYSNFALLFSVMKDNSFVFLAQTPYTLDKNSAHWSKIFELLSGWVRIHKIPHVIFETTSHFLFKFRSWEITLLYFFSWKLISFWRRKPTRVPNFRLSISPNLYLDRLLLLKLYKISAKKVQRCFVSWNWRLMQSLKKNWFVVSKLTRIWWIFIRALKSIKNLHFDWFCTWKVCNVWSKKV